MTISALKLELRLRRTWLYWPCYGLAIIGGQLGMWQSAEQAAQFVMRHGMKVERSKPVKGY